MKEPRQAPPLVVLIPGAGRQGTRHPFFPECTKELKARGFNVVKSDVRDADGITPIIDKVRQTVETVGEHIVRLAPGKVIVIGHSQGYLTGGNAIEEWKKKHPLKYDQTGDVIRQQHIIDRIGELTQHKAVVTTGVGQHQMWTAQWYRFAAPRSMITSGGLGTMGYGFPAAIGAQLARPDETVICIDGDGSFQMTMCELATAAYYKIPVKVFIMDNAHHGMVRQWQELFYNRRYSGSQLGPSNPDFLKLAEAHGVFALRLESKHQVDAVIKKALEHKGPVLVHCRVAQEDNVYPMVPTGHALDQVMDMA
jgi:thiamine pyrophosphate-dependent acetolactate synthase large subunit-like protein